MGGRYYLTGVQLGILMSSLDEEEKREILQKIMDDQYLEEKVMRQRHQKRNTYK